MKRKSVKVFVCTAVMALAMVVTACGGSKDAAEGVEEKAQEEVPVADEIPAAEEEETADEETPAVEDEAPTDEETSAEDETPAEEDAADSGSMTLEEFLADDPETEQMLKEQIAAQGNDQADVSIDIKENELIYTITAKESVEMVEGAAEGLQKKLEENASIYASRASLLDQIIGAEKGTVAFSLKYCDSDGNVIAEASFRAE